MWFEFVVFVQCVALCVVWVCCVVVFVLLLRFMCFVVVCSLAVGRVCCLLWFDVLWMVFMLLFWCVLVGLC